LSLLHPKETWSTKQNVRIIRNWRDRYLSCHERALSQLWR
jgi:hypothetical protein